MGSMSGSLNDGEREWVRDGLGRRALILMYICLHYLTRIAVRNWQRARSRHRKMVIILEGAINGTHKQIHSRPQFLFQVDYLPPPSIHVRKD
jgi:hypothetical protein